MIQAPPDTNRLSFRAWLDDDLDRFHDICSDPRVMEHVGNGEVWSRQQAAQFIQSATGTLREQGFCQWPVFHKSDHRLIGYCGFVKTGIAPEIGWRLSPEYWGKGLATEAARAILQYGFETLRFNCVVATVQAANAASIRVIDKLGMQLEDRFDRAGREVRIYAIESNAPSPHAKES
ncbi:MAG: GNAT family N-acetyltransferase [Planctomycetales bacterium]|nr:GNAT family N-acetyltransferase [Planctomycetales bacterium]